MDLDIRPDVNILTVLKNLNYKPWFALAEFVDNAVQSFQAGREEGSTLTISIDIDSRDGGSIVIRDDAFGISAEDFPRAFRAAEVPPDRSGLSEFGMGMKSAATWFANRWTVRTSTYGEAVERSVEFDMVHIAERQIGQLPVFEVPAEVNQHYTIVELTRLNQTPRGRTVDKIKRHLTGIYRMFLREGLMTIRYNGEVLQHHEVEILRASPAWDRSVAPLRWSRDVEFTLAGGQGVRGWVAIREKGSTKEAGLSLFRRRRLIVGSDDEKYRPGSIFRGSNSFEYQRLFGELILDGFDVSYTKDGIIWSGLEDQFLDALEADLREGGFDLLKQAREYRASDLSRSQAQTLQQDLSEVAQELGISVASVSGNFAPGGDGAGAVQISDSRNDENSVSIARSGGDEDWGEISAQVRIESTYEVWVIKLIARNDQAEADWLTFDDAPTPHAEVVEGLEEHVKVVVNLRHPFSIQHFGAKGENARVMLLLAGMMAVAIVRARRGGFKVSPVVSFLNELLRRPIDYLESTR